MLTMGSQLALERWITATDDHRGSRCRLLARGRRLSLLLLLLLTVASTEAADSQAAQTFRFHLEISRDGRAAFEVDANHYKAQMMHSI